MNSSTKKLDIAAIIVSVVVLAVVIALFYAPTPATTPDFVYQLPKIYASCNALTAISLIAALYFVKNKNIKMHQNMIYSAMSLSALFLVGYVVYHLFTDPTRYGDLDHNGMVDAAEKTVLGNWRAFYFLFLSTHVILAAVILPFILFTFIRGYTQQIPQHKRLARWTFPLWLYVAITGVLCYWMISPYYIH